MIKLKTEVNKSALMREIKQQALDIYENSSESYEKSQAFIAGAEAFFDLLRLPVVIVSDFCECGGVQDLHAMTGECRKCGKECDY